jgi:hypothetical protein
MPTISAEAHDWRDSCGVFVCVCHTIVLCLIAVLPEFNSAEHSDIGFGLGAQHCLSDTVRSSCVRHSVAAQCVFAYTLCYTPTTIKLHAP